jgi:hypothetical protein
MHIYAERKKSMFILSSNTVLWSVLFAIIGIVLGVAAALFVPIFG